MSVVYEVNLVVDRAIADDYLAWLEPHIHEVLQCNGFLTAELFEIDEPQDTDRRHFSVRYEVAGQEALQAYFEGPAQALRAEGTQRFGNRFSASRRIMKTRGAFN